MILQNGCWKSNERFGMGDVEMKVLLVNGSFSLEAVKSAAALAVMDVKNLFGVYLGMIAVMT